MPLSMTGFGRGVVDAPFGKLITEIQSINRKYLEIFVHLPKDFSRFELEVRKCVGKIVSRGQISIRIHYLPSQEALAKGLPDFETMQALYKGWVDLSEKLQLDPQKIDMAFLAERAETAKKLEIFSDEDFSFLEKSIVIAIEPFLAMKEKEGKALAQDILGRLDILRKQIDAIEASSGDAAMKLRQKMLARIAPLFPESAELDERIAREVALFAEKGDISEEIVRFRSHTAQFHESLKAKEAVGKKMDFIVQEMGREINTIGSKVSDANLSHLVIEMKSELEKIREQIQNVE